MVFRHVLIPRSLLFLLFSAAVLALEGQKFDCKFTIDNLNFDLTPLNGEQGLDRERETPPTKWEDKVVFNLCDDLKEVGGQDQCPTGTRCCLTKVNKKEGENNRIVAVIPVVKTDALEVTTSITTSPKGLSLFFEGPSYPPSSSDSTAQSLNVSLLCTTEKSNPQFKSYDGSQLHVEWSVPEACGSAESGGGNEKGDDTQKDGETKASVGSGIGWFFLVLLLALATYFGLGAYYNYTTYGASGADLIPHRNFWKEVPYMLSDVASHLCSSVRHRRTASRGGYISV